MSDRPQDEVNHVVLESDDYVERINYTSGAVVFKMTDDQLEEFQEDVADV